MPEDSGVICSTRTTFSKESSTWIDTLSSVNGVAIPVTNIASSVVYCGFPIVMDTSVVISTGAAIWDWTVTVKLVVPTLPAQSLAEQVTSVVPIVKKEPEDGVHVGPRSTPELSSVTCGNA